MTLLHDIVTWADSFVALKVKILIITVKPNDLLSIDSSKLWELVPGLRTQRVCLSQSVQFESGWRNAIAVESAR